SGSVGSLVEAIEFDVTGGPGCAGVVEAHGLEMEWGNHAAIVGWVGSIRRYAIHIGWESIGGAIVVQVAKVGIKRTVLLRHENNVIQRRYSRIRRRDRSWRRN